MASKQRYPKICLLVTGTRNFGSSIRARDEYGNNKHLYETYFGPIESSFNVMENQFPEMDTLHEYDVFILTGSTARISLEKKEWIDNLLDMIGLIIRLNKVLFGFCFGHQIISKYLGAAVGIRDYPRNGLIDIPLNKLGEKLIGLPKLYITFSHNDEVKCIKGTQLVRLSKGTNDILVLYDINKKIQIFTCQGHPELDLDMVIKLRSYMFEFYNRHTIDRYNIYNDLKDKKKLQLREVSSQHVITLLKLVMDRKI